MNFKQAVDKLSVIAEGKYRSLSYEIVTYTSGVQKQVCSVYVVNIGWHEEPTWEEAFVSLRRAIKRDNLTIEPIEELCKPNNK